MKVLIFCTIPVIGFIHLLHADDLQPFGDEFDDPASLSQWQDLGIVEGWERPSVEAADIHSTTPGHFRIVPGAITWFGNLQGALFFKTISGDFVATLRLRILSRHNPGDPMEVPIRNFSLSGIFAHAPRPWLQRAAPDPYGVAPVWPPGDFGSDWIANTENYIFLSYGSAGNPGTRQFEIKATRDSDSRLYFDSTGIDQNANEAWLQMVRIGDTVVCLRKHAAGDPWIVENRYPNANHPFPVFASDLQVGITAYSNWSFGADTAETANAGGPQTSWQYNYAPPAGNPDLISEVDYFRYQRPDPALSEATLQAMAASYNPASGTTSAVFLSASPAASPYLGNNANVPVGRLGVQSVVAREIDGQAVVTVSRTGSLAGAVSCHFATSTDTATSGDFATSSGTLHWTDGSGSDQQIILPLTNDALAEGTEQFTLTLDQIDGPANFSGGALTRVISVPIEDHPLDQWRLDSFGASANLPEGQLEADFDDDDLANLFEFALGSDAADSSSGAAPVAGRNGDRLTLTFSPSMTVTLPELVVEASSSLSPDGWIPLATRASGSTDWVIETIGAEVNVDGSGSVTVTDSLDISTAGRRFLRASASVENTSPNDED